MDEDALELFLTEEEFDDDSIIEQNMIDDGSVGFTCRKTYSNDMSQNTSRISPSFSIWSKPNSKIDFKTKETNIPQVSTTFKSSSSNDLLNNDCFLHSIVDLNTKLGYLIKSCRNLSSELKGNNVI